MKKTIFVLGLAMLSLASCTATKTASTTTVPDMHTSENALSYDGIYRGVLPCADCEGIKTTLYIMQDKTFKMVSEYLGKEESTFETKGTFTWDKTGSIIILKEQDGTTTQYEVGEDVLTMLGQDGKAVTGALAKNYILTKGNYAILNKKWKLTELMGKPITSSQTMNKEAFLMLDDKENRYSASVGCNTISGAFTVESFNRITLQDGISTMMACENNDLEIQLKQALKTADSFQVNGDELILIKGRMAPLAKFKIPMH
ncbi:copper resistance protein NlpE N-terminal domain-containing protein [Elizabethkingia sp. JS20170427COW]|uniref:copper resistance protein NlpE N-terminal domain-containing protein n=1 Tax=Elizabethkingia sp. JS20170427COW TaxID=2583851 RepID=UPI00111075AE|nr:copper resistance protein NlpE N-terminal domain-containing protein [Elizabethkingia sp. JS20170427COW]QCX53921.1 META domain-containing protein [Elizabethkingia sp. JS20170427COW]